jgi:hypothetical protein
MCYHLTFLMSRSLRSVSLPAALFYADLAAKLARCLLKYDGPDGSDSSLRRGNPNPRVEQGWDSTAPQQMGPSEGGKAGPAPIVAVQSFYSMAKVHQAIEMKQYFV